MQNKSEILPYASPVEKSIDYSTFEKLMAEKGAMNEPHDEVTRSDINHWCEVMHDDNPLYTDEEYAEKGPYGTIIAPPAMAQAWALDTFYAAMARFVDGVTIDIEDPHSRAFAALDAAGYTAVMATNQTLEVFLPIKLGDRISCQKSLGRVSDYDHFTRQGIARYADIVYTFFNQDRDIVSKLIFTVIKYKPPMTTRRLYKG